MSVSRQPNGWVNKIPDGALDLIKKHEGLRLNAYLCPAGVPTIGWGNTFYRDGSKVKMGDRVTRQQAEDLLILVVERFAAQVRELVKTNVTDNQFSALLSFAYNIGVAALRRSTLLRKVNANPNDPTIRNEFMKWVRAGGRELPGLVRRRREEAELYFK